MIVFFVFLIIVAVVYLYLVAPAKGGRKKLVRYKGVMWAHRGLHDMEGGRLPDTGGAPENSMEAFRRAVDEGCGIELDIHMTRDGQLAVFHDDDLRRMCGIDRKVEDMTAAELSGLTLSGTGQHIPMLPEVLRFVDGKVPLLIEIKLMSADTSICRKLIEELRGYKGEYLVQSFNCIALWWLRKNASDVARGQLSENLTRRSTYPHYALRFVVKHLLTNFLARPDFISYRVQDCKTPGLFLNRHLFRAPVAVWTVQGVKQLDLARKRFQMCIFEHCPAKRV